jgi:hypothetical protein
MKKNGLLLLAIVVLVLAVLACGSSSTPVVISTSTSGQGNPVATNPPAEQPTTTTAAPAQVQTFKVGDVVQTGSQTITMNSAKITGTALQANFTIENKGTDNLAVSSIIDFNAKGSDGTKLDQDIMNCPSGSLDGTIVPNDKLKGNICWSGVATDTVKIYYTPDFLSDTVIIWEVSK